MEYGTFWYHLVGWIGMLIVLIVASIGLWRTGQLRDVFDKYPMIDEKAEKLADFYDKTYPELLAAYEELKKKIEELLRK